MDRMSRSPFSAVPALLTVLLAACSSGGSSGGGAPGDTTAPVVSTINLPSGSTLGPGAQIVVTFNEPMNPLSLRLGGTMAAESNGGVWAALLSSPTTMAAGASATTSERLTIGPVTQWTGGPDRTLSIDVKDVAGNALDTVHLSVTVDATLPTAAVDPPNGTFLAKDAPLTIVFSESMNPATLALDGDLVPEATAAVWSTTTQPDDTATLAPSTTWTLGPRTLTVEANDALGNPLNTFHVSLVVVDGIIYVSTPGDGGDDGQPGTKQAPKATIPAGIAAAAAFSPGVVLVSHGTHPVDSGATTPTHVVLAEGISVYGGYSADFSRRDPVPPAMDISEANTTIIVDVSTARAATARTNSVVEANGPITAATVLDGFLLRVGGVSASSGIYIHFQASPTVQHNTIDAGSNTTGNSFGIFSLGNPTIQNNTITGGSVGIQIEGYSAPSIRNNTIEGTTGIYSEYSSAPSIRNNTISGGSGASSYGILITQFSSPTIENNTITGGSGRNSHGIMTLGGSPSIKSNTISGGNGDSSYGIVITQLSSPTIENNTIAGGSGDSSYGIVFTPGSGSTPIQNNSISGGSGTYSYGIQIRFPSTGSGLPEIRNNTIDGGSGATQAIGIDMSGRGTPMIQNNIVFTSGNGQRYCLYNLAVFTIVVFNNDLFDCPTALYSDGSTLYTLTDISGVNSLPYGRNNVSIDPQFADRDGPDHQITSMEDNDWHLTASSHASVTQGGLDLSAAFTAAFPTDQDGTTRTAPWSMGAYELDGQGGTTEF
ncbi:MAG: right-handed parallel beta-helix repeat-containing protein [Nitrospirota bacterium]